MKILFFYTFHRHVNELTLQKEFFNINCKNICQKHQVDCLFHCNRGDIPSDELAIINDAVRGFNAKNKWLVVTNKNNGYTTGHIEAWCDFEGLTSNYDLVIALHPDVYIIDATKLTELINSHTNNIDFYVYQLAGKDQFTTDFLIYRPTSSPILKEYLWQTVNASEIFLYDTIISNEYDDFNINFVRIDRSGTENATRIVDRFGLLHTHDLNQAEQELCKIKNTK